MFWQSKKSEQQDMETAAQVVQFVDDVSDRQLLRRFLSICIAVNLVIWSLAILFAERIYLAMSYILTDRIGMLILGIPFGLGLYITYCLIRWKLPEIEANKQLDSDMMASFAYQSDSVKRWYVWLGSILGGVLNVTLLIVANSFFADQM